MRSIAVILAAGEGRRMGVPLALLEYAPQLSFVDKMTALLQAGGCEVVCVIGAEAEKVRALHPLMSLVENSAWRNNEVGSIQVGLGAALRANASVVLLCPVECPGAKPQTIRLLANEATNHEAVVPVNQGRQGAPIALSRDGAARLLAMSDTPTFDAMLQRLAVKRLPVQDAGVLQRLDTPEAYQNEFGHAPREVTP